MLNKKIFEDKTLEKVLSKCEKELNVTSNEIIYNVLEEKNGLFGKVSIEVIKKDELIENIKEFIDTIGKYLEVDIKSDISISDEVIKVNLSSDNSASLIGKNGKMLNSIQIILKKFIEVNASTKLKLNVDIENYKERKIETLEKNIQNIIKEVQTTKIDAKLDEMNSYERRIVHNLASEYENITSESEGVAPHRYVVIKYVER